MVRTTQTFYIVNSTTGHIINTIKAKRGNFGHGPFVKVHDAVHCLTEEQGSGMAQEGYLYIPDEIAERDITGTGHLRVKMVEVSSYCSETTKKMTEFFYNASKVKTYKETLDVAAIVGERDAGAVVAMVIGKKRANLNAIVKGAAKVYTVRETAPYVFHIHAYTVKDKLAVRIRLEKAVRKIKSDLDSRGAAATPPRAPRVQKRSNRFSGFNEEEADYGTSVFADEEIARRRRGGGAVVDMESFPTLSSDERPRRLNVDLLDTLATKLQDAAARGEVFDETVPVRPCSPDSVSTEDSMPALLPGLSGDELFAAAAAGASHRAIWS